MDIKAKITGIKYKPNLCSFLKEHNFSELNNALSNSASFILNVNKKNSIAVSRWVSPKRTRSYPYARIYDTLGFSGKKITIIPIVKDEGKDGDRDFLQWDTVSLMSLLDVNVIIAYYNYAEKNTKYQNKITNQKFDIKYIEGKINEILTYHLSPLYWNLQQIDEIANIAEKALEGYGKISKDLGSEMHDKRGIETRIAILKKGKEEFMRTSRDLAKSAQNREVETIQPKEHVRLGKKARLTINDYLGGCYYFTVDEAYIEGDEIFLVEAKHTNNNYFPSIGDIKDALLTMILLANLKKVEVGNKKYVPKPVTKLTMKHGFDEEKLSKTQREIYSKLKNEAKENNFILEIR